MPVFFAPYVRCPGYGVGGSGVRYEDERYYKDEFYAYKGETLVYALINFIATIAILKYMETGGLD